MSGILFSYANIIFGEFYFSESKEPHETHLVKLSRKLSIVQYISHQTYIYSLHFSVIYGFTINNALFIM